ncbi:unnamed protein product, partial [Prorocentrum cordatum]
MANDLGPQDTANALWALERLRALDLELLAALGGQALRSLRLLRPAGLAAVLTALARACRGVPPERWPPVVPRLVGAVAGEVPALVAPGRCGHAEFAQVCWAFATLAHTEPATYERLAAAGAAIGWGVLQPRDLGTVAWSFATAGTATEPFMRAVAAASVPAVSQFDPQGVANLCWAFAASRAESSGELFAAVCPHAAEAAKAGAYSARQLSNISWAFASSACLDDELMESVALQSCRHIREFRGAELGALVWSFATVSAGGCHAAALAEAAAKELVASPGAPDASWTAREVANTVWALAVLDHHSGAAVRHAAGVLSRARQAGEALDMHLGQWYFAWLGLTLLRAAGPEALAAGAVDPAWVQECQGSAKKQAVLQHAEPGLWGPVSAMSRLHRDVGAELRRLVGADTLVEDEYVIHHCLVVDLVLPTLGIALEVDGPGHFAHRLRPSAGQDALQQRGASRLKRRLLRQLGWDVRAVRWLEWDSLRSASQKRDHLRAVVLD